MGNVKTVSVVRSSQSFLDGRQGPSRLRSVIRPVVLATLSFVAAACSKSRSTQPETPQSHLIQRQRDLETLAGTQAAGVLLQAAVGYANASVQDVFGFYNLVRNSCFSRVGGGWVLQKPADWNAAMDFAEQSHALMAQNYLDPSLTLPDLPPLGSGIDLEVRQHISDYRHYLLERRSLLLSGPQGSSGMPWQPSESGFLGAICQQLHFELAVFIVSSR